MSESVGRMLGSGIAGLIPGGSAFSAPAGAIGGWIGKNVGKWLGLGAYVEQNTLINGQSMAMHSDDDTVIIRHSCKVMDIRSSASSGGAAYKVTYLPVNPGLPQTFPWAYRAASLYTKYKPRGVVWSFKSDWSEFANAGPLGFVAMAINYNPVDGSPYPNQLALENAQGSGVAPSHQSFWIGQECKPSRNVLDAYYIRDGPVPEGATINMYDPCQFAIATWGQSSPEEIVGELWCTYEFEFSVATMTNITYNNSATDVFYYTGPAKDTSTATAASTPAAGSLQVADNTLGGAMFEGVGGYYFPPNITSGDYLVVLVASGGTGYPGIVSFNNQENCDNHTPELFPVGSGVTGFGGPPSTTPVGTAAQTIMVGKLAVTGPNASFGMFFGSGTGTAAPSKFSLVVVAFAHQAIFPASVSSQMVKFFGQIPDNVLQELGQPIPAAVEPRHKRLATQGLGHDVHSPTACLCRSCTCAHLEIASRQGRESLTTTTRGI